MPTWSRGERYVHRCDSWYFPGGRSAMGANWEGEDANDVSIIHLRVRNAMEIGFKGNACWRMYVMFQSFSARNERSRFLFLIVFLSHAQNVKILNITPACTNFQTGRWKMLHLEKISSHSCKRICLISIMGLGRKLSNWNWKNWKITNLREWTGPALFQVQVRCQMAQRKRIKTFIRN